ncbi:hypothetical protein R1flu_014795 [Riccia fluitans]|uniref:Uncharacterized protein n=1 Tax=Riccia fluitans TaxID=41844 RepID=A0ABD1YH48_9MARC
MLLSEGERGTEVGRMHVTLSSDSCLPQFEDPTAGASEDQGSIIEQIGLAELRGPLRRLVLRLAPLTLLQGMIHHSRLFRRLDELWTGRLRAIKYLVASAAIWLNECVVLFCSVYLTSTLAVLSLRTLRFPSSFVFFARVAPRQGLTRVAIFTPPLGIPVLKELPPRRFDVAWPAVPLMILPAARSAAALVLMILFSSCSDPLVLPHHDALLIMSPASVLASHARFRPRRSVEYQVGLISRPLSISMTVS